MFANRKIPPGLSFSAMITLRLVAPGFNLCIAGWTPVRRSVSSSSNSGMSSGCIVMMMSVSDFSAHTDENELQLYTSGIVYELHREKTGYCIWENKDADQLRGNREADQHLCFRYADSTIPLLSKSVQASSHLLQLYSLVCVRAGRKPHRPVFSRRGSYVNHHFILIVKNLL